MKKTVSLILCVILSTVMLLSTVSADYDEATLSDLVITELVPNTSCDLDGSGKDSYEYMEIFNTSDKTLNLYDYSLLYNSNIDKNEYPNKKTDIVPGETSTSLVDTSLTPANPETAIIRPGQVFLIWMWNFDSYKVAATLDDFRAFWDLDDSLAVYVVDADNSEATGNTLRFNLANSDQKGYYIAPNTYSLDSQSTAGAMTYNYWRKAEMTDGASVADIGSHYICSNGGNKKQMIFSTDSEATPGVLSEEQLASFPAGTATELVTEAAVTTEAATEPATTAQPETDPATTAAPAAATTEPKAETNPAAATDSGTSGGSGTMISGTLLIWIGVGVLAVIAIVVVIIVLVKRK